MSSTPSSPAAFDYQSGFGNQFVSEAPPGALPVGRNSPQCAPQAEPALSMVCDWMAERL